MVYVLCSGVLLSLLLLHPGLFPAQSSDQVVGSVRDSVYCCVAVWSLYLSYNRMDDDRGKLGRLEIMMLMIKIMVIMLRVINMAVIMMIW